MYGWLIKHERSGAYGVVTAHPGGVEVTVVSDPAAATLFEKRGHALEVIAHCERESSTFPDCDVVDYSTPDAGTPDADQAPVPTLAEIIAAAREQGAERRADHAAGRAARRSQPSARLIEKSTPSKVN